MVKYFTKARLAASAVACCWAGFDGATGSQQVCAEHHGPGMYRIYRLVKNELTPIINRLVTIPKIIEAMTTVQRN